MIAGYLARDTVLHRIPVGAKLLVLAGVGLSLPFTDAIWPLVVGLAAVFCCYWACGREAFLRLKFLRMLLPVLIAIGVIQAMTMSWSAAVISMARLLLMILLADLVTLSSTMQAMMDALHPVLRPFRCLGLNTRKLALAVALVMRFIPFLLAIWREREEAYRARTGRRANWRLIAPFLGETLLLADRIAETLDARGFGIRHDSSQ